MQLLRLGLVCCLAVGVMSMVAADDPPQKGVTAEKGQKTTKTVIVPLESKEPCEVAVKDTVRITATGIAGSEIKVSVEGAAKLESTTQIIQRAGKSNMIGGFTEEYEIKPTKVGPATVKVTIKPPTGAEPTVKEYKLLVK